MARANNLRAPTNAYAAASVATETLGKPPKLSKVTSRRSSQCDLADDERVHADGGLVKKRNEPSVARPKLIDPNGGVGEDHCGRGRRRGGAFEADLAFVAGFVRATHA